MIILLGDAGPGGAGDSATVSQTFQPSGRWAASSSPYAFSAEAQIARQRRVDGRAEPAVRNQQGDLRLRAEELLLERIGRGRQNQIRRAADMGVETAGEIRREVAVRNLAREGDVTARGNVGVVEDRREREAGLRGRGRELPKKPGTQKLTPPSSAVAGPTSSAAARTSVDAANVQHAVRLPILIACCTIAPALDDQRAEPQSGRFVQCPRGFSTIHRASLEDVIRSRQNSANSDKRDYSATPQLRILTKTHARFPISPDCRKAWNFSAVLFNPNFSTQ